MPAPAPGAARPKGKIFQELAANPKLVQNVLLKYLSEEDMACLSLTTRRCNESLDSNKHLSTGEIYSKHFETVAATQNCLTHYYYQHIIFTEKVITQYKAQAL